MNSEKRLFRLWSKGHYYYGYFFNREAAIRGLQSQAYKAVGRCIVEKLQEKRDKIWVTI